MTQLTLELTDELLGLDFPDFSVVMEDEPEWRRESALLSFFLRPCRDFNLEIGWKWYIFKARIGFKFKFVNKFQRWQNRFLEPVPRF